MCYLYWGCMMTEEEIFALAIKADLYLDSDESVIKFGKLIAEKEREECAKICEESEYPDGIDLAYLIRARGQE